jgi:TonB family protein
VAVLQVQATTLTTASARPEPTVEVTAPDLIPLPATETEPIRHLPVVQMSRASHAVAHGEPLERASHAQAIDEPNTPPDAAPEAVPRAPTFALSVPVGPIASGVVASSARAAASLAERDAPLSESAADAPAKLSVGAPPAYTLAARQAGIEAEVPLEIVVDSTGVVQSARSESHVGYGLDEAAVGAVRGYRFIPARLAGRATAVRMRWLMRFQLR